MNAHYTKLAESIIHFALSRSESASELAHPGLRGRAREIFARDLLTPFLSPNIGVCTGIVVDSRGGSSRQIDIIIYDKTLIPSLMFTGEEGIVPIESVLATVEVKSTLTRDEVKKSIQNAHSVKTLDAHFAEVMPETPQKSSPVCCVFSFSSDTKPDKELIRLEEVVSEVNQEVNNAIYVPLSGVCVANTSFTRCVKIENRDRPVPSFRTTTENAAMEFMVFLIDQVSIMERQRSKMLIYHYFLG
ncbi:MAG: hypothetical protein HY706_16650 [Candidatus Hydrogenedentes bacterium]|nr:hypothetical protein [Candidatus Hydrogenedentota bacterium]